MLEFSEAIERFGWKRMETAAYVWAGRMRRQEAGCPRLVAAWRRALAETVYGAVARWGVDGIFQLAERTVRGIERPDHDADALDGDVARWARLTRALDIQNGVPSSFPLAVLAPGDLRAIADVARELDEARSRNLAHAAIRADAGMPSR